MRHRWLVLLLATTIPALACDANPDANAEAAPAAEEAAEATSATQMAKPDTTARAVWAHLQDASYQDWRLWPGKGELYSGGEPHGMLLTTYLNDLAHEALTTGRGPLPDGAIVVKENYMPDSTLAAVTVMYVAEGYDAEHDDWFWAKYQPDGSVDAAGRVQGCIACHSASDRSYLRTPYDGGM